MPDDLFQAADEALGGGDDDIFAAADQHLASIGPVQGPNANAQMPSWSRGIEPRINMTPFDPQTLGIRPPETYGEAAYNSLGRAGIGLMKTGVGLGKLASDFGPGDSAPMISDQNARDTTNWLNAGYNQVPPMQNGGIMGALANKGPELGVGAAPLVLGGLGGPLGIAAMAGAQAGGGTYADLQAANPDTLTGKARALGGAAASGVVNAGTMALLPEGAGPIKTMLGLGGAGAVGQYGQQNIEAALTPGADQRAAATNWQDPMEAAISNAVAGGIMHGLGMLRGAVKARPEGETQSVSDQNQQGRFQKNFDFQSDVARSTLSPSEAPQEAARSTKPRMRLMQDGSLVPVEPAVANRGLEMPSSADPHAVTQSLRRQLEAMGWSVPKYKLAAGGSGYISAERPGGEGMSIRVSDHSNQTSNPEMITRGRGESDFNLIVGDNGIRGWNDFAGSVEPVTVAEWKRAIGDTAAGDLFDHDKRGYQGAIARESTPAQPPNEAPGAYAMDYAMDKGFTYRETIESRPESEWSAMRREAMDVTRLVRGPIDDSEKARTYRTDPKELFADWSSLYIHDPVKAREVAPTFTKAFEAKLADHPEVGKLLSELHAGDVQPVAPERKGGGMIPEAVEPTGRFLRPKPAADEQPVAAAQSRRMAIEADRTRRTETAIENEVSAKWEKSVPSKREREDVGAVVEGIGNVRIKGDDVNAAMSRLSPEGKRLVKQYRLRNEYDRQKLNEYGKDLSKGEYLNYLEDYLAHFWVDHPQRLRSFASKFVSESPNTKQRTLPTLKEGLEAGLTPLSQDVALLHRTHADLNWQIVTAKRFAKDLGDLKGADGQALLRPSTEAPAGWKSIDNNIIHRQYGKPMAVHPDLYPAARQILERPVAGKFLKIYDAINNFAKGINFAGSLFHDVTLRLHGIENMGRWWNPARGMAMIAERNPLTGKREVFQRPASVGKQLMGEESFIRDAIGHGLTFGHSTTDSAWFGPADKLGSPAWLAAKTRAVPGLGKVMAGVDALSTKRGKALWDYAHNGLKAVVYNDLVGEALSNPKNAAKMDQVKETIARHVNDTFGGQEWASKFWLSPDARKNLSRVMLAPDWTISTLRTVTGAAEGKQAAGMRGRYWLATAITLGAAHSAMQGIINAALGNKEKGDHMWPWQNEKGHQLDIDVTPLMRSLPGHDPDDKTRRYITLGKNVREILGWFSDPLKTIKSKASPPMAAAVDFATDEVAADMQKDQGKSFVETLPQRVGVAAGHFRPFSFQGNQFMLTAPMSKGTTPFKLKVGLRAAFDTYADPSAISQYVKGFIREGPVGIADVAKMPDHATKGNLDTIVPDLIDAAKANGMTDRSVKAMIGEAQGFVKGKYYADFLKALQANDQKGVESAAIALKRLNAGYKGAIESAKRRGMTLTDDQREAVDKALEQ